MKKIFLSALIMLVLTLPAVSIAHEHQNFRIGDKTYEFTVGSLSEPVFVDDKTGVDLRVVEVQARAQHHHDEPEGTAVIGLEQTLKVEIRAGDRKKVMDLSPAFGSPGAYQASFYPTISTTYNYRLFGTLNNVPVDLTFTCNPAGHPRTPEDTSEVRMSDNVTRIFKSGVFGCPRPRSDVAFPEQTASTVELSSSISSANNEAKSSKSTGVSGIVLGLLGTIIASAALMKSRKVQP